MRRLAAGYLAVQGLVAMGWWAGVLSWSGFRAWFEVPKAPAAALTSFWLADLVFLVAGSFAAALGVARGRPWAAPLLLLVSGAVLYATLYCFALSLATSAAWASFALMVPAAVGTVLCARAAR